MEQATPLSRRYLVFCCDDVGQLDMENPGARWQRRSLRKTFWPEYFMAFYKDPA